MPSDLQFKMSGDAEQLERELEKASRTIAELKENLKQLQKEQGTYKGGLEETVAALGKKVTAFLSVGAAVGLVNKGYQEQKKLLEEISQKALETAKRTVQVLSASGDLARRDELLKAVGPGGLEAFGAVSAAGANLSFERRTELANELKKRKLLGGDVAAEGSLLAGLAEMLSGAKGGDVADVFASVKAQAKGQAGALVAGESKLAFGALQRAGMSPEAALALLTEGVTQDIPAKLLEKVGVAISDRSLTKIEGRGRPLTDEERRYNAFVAADQAQRTQLIQNDPLLQKKFLGDLAPDRLKNLDAARVAQREQMLRDAQANNLAEQDLKALGRTPEGRKLLLEQSREREKARQDAAQQPAADLVNMVDEEFNLQQRHRNLLTRGVMRTAYEGYQFGTWLMNPLVGRGEMGPGGRAIEALDFAGNANKLGQRLLEQQPGSVNRDGNAASEMLQVLKQIDANTKAQANRLFPPVAPNVHGEGAGGLTQ